MLFEAVGLHLFERWGNMHYRVNDGSLDDPAIEDVLPQMYAIIEQGGPYAGLNYGILSNYNNTAVPSWTYRAAMSYVTGSHAFKYGFNRTHGYLDENQYTLNPVAYRFNNGVPNLITERATYRVKTNLDNDLGFYAQDRWTVNRWTRAGRAPLRLLRDQRLPSSTSGRSRSRRTATSPSRRRTSSRGRTSPIAAASPTTSSATARRR